MKNDLVIQIIIDLGNSDFGNSNYNLNGFTFDFQASVEEKKVIASFAYVRNLSLWCFCLFLCV